MISWGLLEGESKKQLGTLGMVEILEETSGKSIRNQFLPSLVILLI